MSCTTIWPMVHQLQRLLILGVFPMNGGLLSPHFTRDGGNYCPVTGRTEQKSIMPSVPAEPPPPYVATTPMILVPGIKSIPTQPTELLATLHPLTSEIGTLPSRPNRYWFRDKTRDTVVSGYSNSQLGIPPISRITIWLMLRQLQPPLLLGGLPMDPGLLSRHFTRLVSDICHDTPVSQSRGSRQALPDDSHSTSGGSCQDPTMHSPLHLPLRYQASPTKTQL